MVDSKILIITPKFYPHIWGIESQTKLLAKKFIDRGYIVEIFTHNYNGKLVKKEIIDNATVYRRKTTLGFLLFMLSHSRDYTFIKISQYYRYAITIWILKILRIVKSITIVTAHSWWEMDEINNIKRILKPLDLYRLYFYLVWQNNYLNCLNQDNYNHLIAINPKFKSQITRIYNGIDVTWKEKHKKRKKIQNILWIGRLEPAKWVFETIEAFKKIDNNNITLHIVWYGSEEIETTLRDMIISDKRIVFHGQKTWIEKERIFEITDLFVFPTYYQEWQPNTIIEAVLYNMPIITTDVANTREIYGENILYVRQQNTQDLQEKIERIIKNIWAFSYDYTDALKKLNIDTIVDEFLWLI